VDLQPSRRAAASRAVCGSDLVTNLAYGGPQRQTLYITDSGMGLILIAACRPPAGAFLPFMKELLLALCCWRGGASLFPPNP